MKYIMSTSYLKIFIKFGADAEHDLWSRVLSTGFVLIHSLFYVLDTKYPLNRHVLSSVNTFRLPPEF